MENQIRFYPQNIREKLEFDRIYDLLKEKCLSDLGLKALNSIDFVTNTEAIKIRLQQTSEMQEVLNAPEVFPVENFYNLDESIRLLYIPNSVLPAHEFQKIFLANYTIKEIHQYFKKTSGNYPYLEKAVDEVPHEPALQSNIGAVIDKEGEVFSSVSNELQRLRKRIKAKDHELANAFDQVKNQALKKGWLSDEGESVRKGRRVLAVTSEHKRNIRGVIHDESSTGKTFFIEPREIFEINNEIVELRQEEKNEVYRILRQLTDDIRPYVRMLEDYQHLLAFFDLLHAKALLANEMKCAIPKIKDEPCLNLVQARHPLLYLQHASEGKVTIPLDINLAEDQNILVISGPNSGGKSVCLKTAGLIQLMFQAGMPVPVDGSSQMGVFENLFIDIGDDQSIDNDLSTYTSHLKNLKYFTDHADSHTLVLVDEMGTGTDPQFGGPIAESILEKLNHQKAYGIVTTHYSNLKVFAAQTQGLENGSMIFDRDTLQPTYQLAIGEPGSSYSFEIARNLGFPDELLENARQKAGHEAKEFDELLAQLEEQKQKANEKDRQLNQKQKELDAVMQKHDRMSKDIEQNKKQILLQNKENALNYLNQLNKKFEKLVKDWKESEKAEKEASHKKVSKEIQKQRKYLEDEVNQLQDNLDRSNTQKQQDPNQLAEGDRVKLKGGSKHGKVDKVMKNKAMVIFDNLKTEAALKDLVKVDKEEPVNSVNKTNVDYTKYAKNFEAKIDVRGMRRDEALKEVEDKLDKAVLLNQHELRILHGKGNGILKSAIKEMLQKYNFVKDTYHENPDYGGEGITIVELSHE